MPPLPTNYDNVLTIPCYDEPPQCLDAVLGRLDASALVILVVNAPSDAERCARQRTEALWRTLGGAAQQPFHFRRWHGGIDLLAINRCAPERLIPRRQGVGLARKIGADLATALIAAGRIHSPWIYMTDADARLSADHCAQAPANPGCALMPFRHEAPPELEQATRCYELHLRHYVDGLCRAGSPYAFHAMGSAIANHADTYAKVRGVPKRNAAEDFHLLNKAAKVAPIHRLGHPEVVLQARLSKRVPFGTGPALARRAAGGSPMMSYAPESFERLAEVMAHIDQDVPLPEATASLLEALGYPCFRARAERQHRRSEAEGIVVFPHLSGAVPRDAQAASAPPRTRPRISAAAAGILVPGP